ncbi:DddA-like double-stranded DNA deaminase toxin [Nocardia sp. NRRL S-836]|uniref:DddA-like double-stranded DNA deaminase toxin n=1 Tax=Nocardia sp. NRRL S-836 TaxID=1519492 RepID=UPI000A4236EE|nr:DddA-like double-stranded DNA deaminase toxin [Nocardia sp. NRRL S-836]
MSSLATAADLTRTYLGDLGVSNTTPFATSSTSTTTSRVEALRKTLPPPVQPGSGSKTHGRWFAEGRIGGEISSGDDPTADDVWRLLREAGLPRPGRPFTASHAEMKLAAHMRANDVRHAEIVINNVPCKLDFGCEALLGVVLPEGFSLTVHGTNGYHRTFTGGRRPPWQR